MVVTCLTEKSSQYSLFLTAYGSPMGKIDKILIYILLQNITYGTYPKTQYLLCNRVLLFSQIE